MSEQLCAAAGGSQWHPRPVEPGERSVPAVGWHAPDWVVALGVPTRPVGPPARAQPPAACHADPSDRAGLGRKVPHAAGAGASAAQRSGHLLAWRHRGPRPDLPALPTGRALCPLALARAFGAGLPRAWLLLTDALSALPGALARDWG